MVRVRVSVRVRVRRVRVMVRVMVRVRVRVRAGLDVGHSDLSPRNVSFDIAAFQHGDSRTI